MERKREREKKRDRERGRRPGEPIKKNSR